MTAAIAPRLLRWAKRHGRHDLPWQQRSGSRNRIAYRVWVAEIMLQQTQVATVIPYFQRFMRAFPSVRTLADAPLDDVLAHWSGLGYYARARNLHRAARVIRDEHRGRLPAQRAQLETLPGIGRSTAAAIVAQTDGQPEAILDGNVKRVLAPCRARLAGRDRGAATTVGAGRTGDATTRRRRLYPGDHGPRRHCLHAPPAGLRELSSGR